jgi:hypothetical protein
MFFKPCTSILFSFFMPDILRVINYLLDDLDVQSYRFYTFRSLHFPLFFKYVFMRFGKDHAIFGHIIYLIFLNCS